MKESSRIIQNFLYLFLYFCCISKKDISLSYAFCSSAWWNWQKAFLFPNGVKVYYLSLLKSSSFYLGERWYNRYSTWMAVYQHISWRCVIYKCMAWMSVVIIIFLNWRKPPVVPVGSKDSVWESGNEIKLSEKARE